MKLGCLGRPDVLGNPGDTGAKRASSKGINGLAPVWFSKDGRLAFIASWMAALRMTFHSFAA